MKKKRGFKGDMKVGKGILSDFENKICDYFVPKIPKFIETYHLTYMTIVWSAFIVLGGFLARDNIPWLWFVSLMIFFQYVTDLFDGKVGKLRKTGLIKWGYYMDHFLDFIFLGAIGIAYSVILPVENHLMMLFIFIIGGGFMANSFLSFAATEEFKIHYFKLGPTEMRIIFILLNTLIIFLGINTIAFALPYLLVLMSLGLIVLVYMAQKKIWGLDEKIKKKKI